MSNTTTNKWVSVSGNFQSKQLTSLERLADARAQLHAQGTTTAYVGTYTCNKVEYYAILRQVSGGAMIWADANGWPYLAPVEPAASAAGNEYKYNSSVVNNTTNNTSTTNNFYDNSTTNDYSGAQIIDNEGGVINMVTETGDRYSFSIDSVVWNEDDRSYTTNCYDIRYDDHSQTYYTTNYTYKVTYNITNTYINYIGSSAEFQPVEYALYYELPDGRSSADLTAEEVSGLSFQFYDCLGYDKTATDASLRALYHFDGDVEDSSYFKDKGHFTWTKGASITYMESNAFNGALYLDETEHDFTVTLPYSFYANADFTVQFRYYQASEPDTLTNRENYVALGGSTMLTWDERTLYSQGSSTSVATLPIGSWCEIAIIRHSGTVYAYLNGIKVASWSNTSQLANTVRFHLGATSRAYSMLDELRVVDFAVAQSGQSYTPTSVPYDSNLVLVLPGTNMSVSSYLEVSNPSQFNVLTSPDFTSGLIDGIKFGASSSSTVREAS